MAGKGRPRKFETEAALDSATRVFWRLGYRGTSLDDLTNAMQINRPSLYSAFGNKEELFLSVIEHYRAKYLGPPTRALMAGNNLQSGLAAFFDELGKVVIGSETPPGCLIACLLSEDCCDSPAIQAKLAESIEMADTVFTQFYEKHRAELKADLSPSDAAGMTTSFTHGLAIRARSGESGEKLAAVVRPFCRSLLLSSSGDRG